MPPPSSDRFSEDAPSPEPPHEPVCEPVCEPARPRLPRLEALSFLSGAGDRGAAVLGPEGKSDTTLQEAGQVWVRLTVVVEVPAAAGSEAPERPGVRVAAATLRPETALAEGFPSARLRAKAAEALRRKAEAMKEAYQVGEDYEGVALLRAAAGAAREAPYTTPRPVLERHLRERRD